MYHYVKDLKSSKFPNLKALDLNDFKKQISYLSKNYNILSIEDFYYKSFPKNKKKNCVLTFDDGYSEHYEYVFEILNKKKIKGCFFPPVDVIKKNNILLDVNKIHLILASADEKKIFDRLKFHFNKRTNSNTLIEKYIKKIDFKSNRYDSKLTVIIKQLLQKILELRLRSKICDDLLVDFIQLSNEELNKKFYLNEKQIREMINSGMHFGSHGKSHLWFASLKYEDQEKEITSSINFLSEIYNTDKYLLTMCYPYGSYNKITLQILKKYDFKLALGTRPEIYDSSKNNILEIPRLDTNDYIF
tara:strand:+ start:121 stop:1026 length:906 start_codon:yes stop_codon:yes gene_type:complete